MGGNEGSSPAGRGTDAEDLRARALVAHVRKQVEAETPTPQTRSGAGCFVALAGLVLFAVLAVVGAGWAADRIGTGIGNGVGAMGTVLDGAFGCYAQAMSPSGCGATPDTPAATLTDWQVTDGGVCVRATVSEPFTIDASQWRSATGAGVWVTSNTVPGRATAASLRTQTAPQSAELCFADTAVDAGIEWTTSNGQIRRWSIYQATTPQRETATTR